MDGLNIRGTLRGESKHGCRVVRARWSSYKGAGGPRGLSLWVFPFPRPDMVAETFVRRVLDGVLCPYLSPCTAMWWIVSDRGDAILKNSLPLLFNPTIDEPCNIGVEAPEKKTRKMWKMQRVRNKKPPLQYVLLRRASCGVFS